MTWVDLDRILANLFDSVMTFLFFCLVESDLQASLMYIPLVFLAKSFIINQKFFFFSKLFRMAFLASGELSRMVQAFESSSSITGLSMAGRSTKVGWCFFLFQKTYWLVTRVRLSNLVSLLLLVVESVFFLTNPVAWNSFVSIMSSNAVIFSSFCSSNPLLWLEPFALVQQFDDYLWLLYSDSSKRPVLACFSIYYWSQLSSLAQVLNFLSSDLCGPKLTCGFSRLKDAFAQF